MTQNEPISKQEVRSIVMNETDSINKVISPNDLIHQDIDSWDNVDIDRLKDELAYNDYTYGINHPYDNLIFELAVSLYMDNMTRIKLDHLVFDELTECVTRGYWPYGENKYIIQETINEYHEDIDFFYEYEQEAQQFVESCMMDAQIDGLE